MLDMVESGFEGRWLLGTRDRPLTGPEFAGLARRGAATLGGVGSVVYAGENHPLLPVALFAAVCAGVPFVPVNYRVDDKQLNALIADQPGALVLTDRATASRVTGTAMRVFDDWLAEAHATTPAEPVPGSDDDVAVVLYTSGTTSAPKAALLRHRHLAAYLMGSVEFGSASPDEAMLVAAPPYHIAGMANLLSNLYAGRRLIYLHSFDAATWLEIVRAERITNAMLVPTMLARIIDELDGAVAGTPTLRTLSYGGAKISGGVLRTALAAFPTTGFSNGYGLTETSATIAVLGPEDHRAAVESDDPDVCRRLSSAGRVLPSVEVQIRDDDGRPLDSRRSGMIFVRGEQIAGEYATGSALDGGGWFCTRDRGWVDEDGYLFIEGRADDTIIRGGENIAPAEIEEALLRHAGVAGACVVGIPDEEWGERIAAVVVRAAGSDVTEDELLRNVRTVLRGAKTPDTITFRHELPHSETGKLLRRVVRQELLSAVGGPDGRR